MAEPLVPDCRRFEVEITVAKFNKYTSPDSYQIPAELIQARDKTLLSAIHKIITFIWC
jgi:hypothetical protein